MTRERKLPFYIVLLSCALVVLGDLRNIITPAGYWALWGLVFVFGAFTGYVRKSKLDGVLIGVTCGFVMLVVALLIASMVNVDVYTAYQALKFLMIYAILVVVFINSQFLRVEQFYTIAAVSTLIGLAVFLLCKYVFISFHIQLGDGRQGSVFAFPGVLWKTSAFFASFVIARLFTSSVYRMTLALLVLMSSMYLLFADSSRTGFLWFAIIIAVFALLKFLVSPARFLSFVSVIALVIGGIVLFNSETVYNIFSGDSVLVLNRLFAGDPIRSKMFSDGVVNAEACLPFGCGFGSSTSSVNGDPMVIHNVYLAILGDLGLLGEVGLLIIVMTPIIVFALREWVAGASQGLIVYYKLAACLGVLCYCFVLLFHPLSSEMSEWGYWAIMLSWLSRLSSIKSESEKTKFGGFELQRVKS